MRFLVFYRKFCESKKFRVFITRPDMPDIGIKILREKCDLTIWKSPIPIPRKDFLTSIRGMNALFVTIKEKIDGEVLDAAGPQLKVVATISVGHDHLDVAECRKRGIRVANTPELLTDATAELTLALLLCTSRRLPEALNAVRDGGWTKWSLTWMVGPGLADATVGIVGFGRIGQAVAKRIKPFQVARILYSNRSERPNDIGATRVTFDELLKESDFVICCIAFTPDSKEIFNRSAFEKMKKTAIFINTSRGGTVDQAALIEILKEGKIRAAGLDVTTPEPLPLDSPLLKLKNCVVLPHIGSATIEATNAIAEMTARNILAGLTGDRMPGELK